MKKSIMLISILGVMMNMAHAGLEPIANNELSLVNGQASAATIDWVLSLNQVSAANATAGYLDTYSFNTTACTDLRFCRFAMSLNNRQTTDGKKQWVVMKGMQGTIHLQNVQLDGVDLLYKNASGQDQIKAALQLTFDAAHPIRIRNFGFDALAIETDTVANEGAGNVPGYLVPTTAGTGTYTYNANTFDGKHPVVAGMGRETGFTGLQMNGNLAVQGTLKVFSCSADMPRC